MRCFNTAWLISSFHWSAYLRSGSSWSEQNICDRYKELKVTGVAGSCCDLIGDWTTDIVAGVLAGISADRPGNVPIWPGPTAGRSGNTVGRAAVWSLSAIAQGDCRWLCTDCCWLCTAGAFSSVLDHSSGWSTNCY
jgi:hypothetical protein